MYYASQPSLGRLKTQGKQPKRSGFIKLFTDSFSYGSKWLGCILFFGLFLPVTDAQAICNAPTISGSPGNGSANVTITAAGAGPVTNYSYSTNGVSYTAFSPAKTSTSSPFSIGGLTNGTTYTIRFKKNCDTSNQATGGNSTAISSASNAIFVTPAAQVPSAPTSLGRSTK